MGKKLSSAVCTSCREEFAQKAERTFLGFRRFHCPGCGSKVLYPLTTGYRRVYWVIAVLSGLAVAVALMQGRLAAPAWFVLAMIWALDKDRRVRAEVREVGTRG